MTMDDFESYAIAAGFDPLTLSDAPRSALCSAWQFDLTQQVGVAAKNEIQAAFEESADGMNAEARERLHAVKETAEREGWDLQRAKLEFLRARRPTGHFMATATSGAIQAQVSEAAL